MSIIDDVLLDQGGAVFNVKSSAYGAKGDGTTNDGPAIQKALDAAGAAGGTVFIPQGTYRVKDTLNVPSRTSVQGVGQASLLAGDENGPPKILMQVAGVSNVRITDLAIDVNSAKNYVQAIYITSGGTPVKSSRDVRVERCHLYNTREAEKDWYTMMAIRSSSEIWICNNRVDALQIKAAGGLGAQRVTITGNHIRKPQEYGITFVSDQSGGVVTDCVIADNILTDVGASGGIYFGCDQHGEVAIVCERIAVTGNLLSGAPRQNGTFIHGSICSTSLDWTIRGNIIRNTAVPPQSYTLGIQVVPRDAAGIVQNLVIADNVVAGTNAGIQLAAGTIAAGATGFVVQGNTLETAQGIEVSGSAYSLGRVTGNILRGGSIQLVDCGPVDVHDNTVQTGASAAIAVQTSAAGQQVTASVTMNRLLASMQNGVNGVKETGPGTFGTRYFGNVVTGNTGPALALASPDAAQMFNACVGSLPLRQLSGSTLCAAQTVAAGDTVTETIDVPGASVGDGVTVSSTSISTPGWQVSALVTVTDTVTVSITNATGAAATLSAGTLRAIVWGY